MWSFVSSLLGALWNALLSPLLGWLAARRNVQIGVSAQAAAETKETTTAQRAIDQAEANSPRTDAGVEESLKDGSF